MRELVAMLSMAIVMLGIVIGVWSANVSTADHDVYLESGQKVMSVQMDSSYRMLVVTRNIHPDEPPEVIRVYRYPDKSCWTIHESK